MYYFEVVPLTKAAKINQVATYEFESMINRGSLVEISYGRKNILGIVWAKTAKPKFKTKPISNLTDVKLEENKLQLAEWFSGYYSVSKSESLSMLIPSGVIKTRRASYRPLVSGRVEHKPLSPNQEKIVQTIKDSRSPWVLHGVTGSGKTHVYADLIKENANKGLSSILLLPEISLSEHLLNRLVEMMDVPIVHIHSKMTESQRHLAWNHVNKSESPLLVVGPRSALFMPVKKLGLIIVDECHDASYKQGQTPHYDANYVAAQIAKLSKVRLVYGSATPPINLSWLAEQKILQTTKLEHSYHEQKQTIEIVNTSDKSNYIRSQIISERLLNSIVTSLKESKQSLLFVNRRGYASIIKCDDCGWQQLCPKCRLNLTYHSSSHRAICHTCGIKQDVRSSCPKCQSSSLRLSGTGTQKLAKELSALFPGVSISRIDSDSTAGSKNIDFEQSDILVGTQMIIKGYDLARLQTVGVINADGYLMMPDFSAAERTFQSIVQVIGRNDRRGLGGKTIIQTSQPDHYAIKTAANLDYQAFYNEELGLRKAGGYPPFKYLMKITARRKSQSSAIKILDEIKAKTPKYISVLGPAPSFWEHAHGYINWHLLIKSSQRSDLTELSKSLTAINVTCELDPIDLL